MSTQPLRCLLLACCTALGACSLAVSLDGLADGVQPRPEGGLYAEAGLDAADAAAPALEAGSVDSGLRIDVVQRLGSTAKTSASFARPTTTGTLLVAMRPDPSPPSGEGWLAIRSSNGADAVFLWPNNPGGLQTFTVPAGGNADIILVEVSGIRSPAVEGKADTGPKGAPTSQLATSIPSAGSGMALLYLDTNDATAASTSSAWTALGTDGNNNFAWFRRTEGGTELATVSFAPESPAALIHVALVGK